MGVGRSSWKHETNNYSVLPKKAMMRTCLAAIVLPHNRVPSTFATP